MNPGLPGQTHLEWSHLRGDAEDRLDLPCSRGAILRGHGVEELTVSVGDLREGRFGDDQGVTLNLVNGNDQSCAQPESGCGEGGDFPGGRPVPEFLEEPEHVITDPGQKPWGEIVQKASAPHELRWRCSGRGLEGVLRPACRG